MKTKTFTKKQTMKLLSALLLLVFVPLDCKPHEGRDPFCLEPERRGVMDGKVTGWGRLWYPHLQYRTLPVGGRLRMCGRRPRVWPEMSRA